MCFTHIDSWFLSLITHPKAAFRVPLTPQTSKNTDENSFSSDGFRLYFSSPPSPHVTPPPETAAPSSSLSHSHLQTAANPPPSPHVLQRCCRGCCSAAAVPMLHPLHLLSRILSEWECVIPPSGKLRSALPLKITQSNLSTETPSRGVSKQPSS